MRVRLNQDHDGVGYSNDGGAFVGNTALAPLLVNPAVGSYGLRGASPCLDNGIVFDWMTNSADVRSLDLALDRRIRGVKVDMGAFEHLSHGTLFMVR